MRRIDSSVHSYICIYVPIPGGSTCPRSLKPHRTLFSSLSSSFALAWYVPVDKSRPPLLKDRGIGDKPESRNGDRETAKSHPLRQDGEMIELNSRATRYSGNLQTREDIMQLTKNDAGRANAITNEATTPFFCSMVRRSETRRANFSENLKRVIIIFREIIR